MELIDLSLRQNVSKKWHTQIIRHVKHCTWRTGNFTRDGYPKWQPTMVWVASRREYHILGRTQNQMDILEGSQILRMEALQFESHPAVQHSRIAKNDIQFKQITIHLQSVPGPYIVTSDQVCLFAVTFFCFAMKC